MPKIKYYFNTHSLKYEKVVVSIRRRALQVVGFLATAVVFGAIIMTFSYSYFESPREKQLEREMSEMELQYDILNGRLDQVTAVIGDLQRRDDDIY
nr:M23 family peptidase [Nitrosopumilus sp.]